jgi:DMSO reductase anchor subunit
MASTGIASTPSEGLVGTSFRPGFRFQRYWDASMAWAFFFAELGSGTFAVSLLLDDALGMAIGLALVLTLKPYFHLAHMGVPGKSWRALLRPDRSWISRGALAIGALGAFGGLHLLDRTFGLGLPTGLANAVTWLALAAAVLVMCYQGFAMSASSSFALWAQPLVPLASFLYAATLGTLVASLLGTGIEAVARAWLVRAAPVLLAVDLAVVLGILALARARSAGGAFSVELLTKGRYARRFGAEVLGLGLVAPLVLLVIAGDAWIVRAIALAGVLAGHYAFRVLMFRAAVYEPITPAGLASSLGLPGR